jgi:UDP-glucuronate decarboxylase
MMKFENVVVKSDLEYVHSCLSEHQNKFKGATVLMTGCAGFLGFYMLNYLVRYSSELGIKKVIGLDNFIIDKPEWIELLESKNQEIFKVHNFDIANDNLSDVTGLDEANYIIHAASIASPIFYRQYPLQTVDANVWGLRKLLDFYNSDKLKGFLFFSSSEIYGDPEPSMIPTCEDYRGNVSCNGPRACYDEAKRFGETLCWIYSEEYKLPITIARPFNNYGPGMKLSDRRLPADFAKAILNQENINILSDGTPTRTFCYVSDAVVGYFLCLLHGKYDFFNIGIEAPEISVRDIADIYINVAKQVLGYDLKMSYMTSDDEDYLTDNPNRRSPSIDKARSLLGYNPTVGVDEGVRRFILFLKQDQNL